jgi:hypothetical protein
VSSPRGFFSRHSHVRQRGVDVNRRTSAVGQQLMVHDPDSRADIEESGVPYSPGAQRVE